MEAWGVSHDATDDVVAQWEGAVIGLLGHHAETGQRVLEIRRTDPSFVPAIALEACGMLFKGRRALHASIAARIAEAHHALEARPSDRDTRLLDALAAWNDGATLGATQRLAELRADAPGDPFLAKLQHGLLFILGRREEMLAVLEDTRDDWMGDELGRGFIRGCLAFALEENGRLEEAEREGRAAVEERPDDAWGIHAVAHVMSMQDRVDECVSWLDQHAAGYSECGIFKRHVYWHWALMLLERDEVDAALHLFDTRVRAPWVGDYRDMSNQTTLLWRLEREGVDVGDRWDALVNIAREHANDHGSAFADAHYAMALARAGEASLLLDSLRTHLEQARGDDVDVQRRVGEPLARLVVDALNATADLEAFAELAPRIRDVGGSEAQREMFELLRLEAAIDARSPLARAWVRERLDRRPNNAWARARLDQIRPS